MLPYDEAAVAKARPADFDDRVIEAMRQGIQFGHVAGVEIRGGPDRAIRFLAQRVVTQCAQGESATDLPPSLRRLSASTRKLLEGTRWKVDPNPARAIADRVVVAVGALEHARHRLAVPASATHPQRPTTTDARLRELCEEVRLAWDAFYRKPSPPTADIERQPTSAKERPR